MPTIKVYSWPTPNGHKVHIMLEECGLPYEALPVNIGAGEQFRPVPDGLVGRDQDRFSAIAIGDQAEEQTRLCRSIGSKPSSSMISRPLERYLRRRSQAGGK